MPGVAVAFTTAAQGGGDPTLVFAPGAGAALTRLLTEQPQMPPEHHVALYLRLGNEEQGRLYRDPVKI